MMTAIRLQTPTRFKPDTANFMAEYFPAAISDVQKNAQNQLKLQGLPTQKLENWNFLNLPLALKQMDNFVPASSQITIDNISFSRGVPDWAQKYFNDGNVDEPTLHTITNAMMSDVYVIDIAPNMNLDEPIEIDWILAGGASAHFIVRVQRNSSIVVREIQAGEAGLRIGRMIFDLEDNARAQHVRMANDDAGTVSLQAIDVFAARDAVYDGFCLNKGGAFSRTEIHGRLTGANAEISLNGLQLQAKTQQADTNILLEHEAPHGRSNQFYKTILANEAVGVFQGKIHVHQAAQKTDGYQMSNGILLSQGATMHTKPQLEIYADDVKCSHGTTTGQLDETPLFYLCSRGISENDARRLLLESTIADVAEKIQHDELREQVIVVALDWVDEIYGA